MNNRAKKTKERVLAFEEEIRTSTYKKILPTKKTSQAFIKLNQLIFKPLMTFIEDQFRYTTRTAQMEFLLAVEERQIITMVVTQPFILPGYIPYPNRPMKNTSPKVNMKPGELVLVRVDIKMPNAIDIEPLKFRDIFFRLTGAEYAAIVNNLDRVIPLKDNSSQKGFRNGNRR
jgi:hypothetical protein